MNDFLSFIKRKDQLKQSIDSLIDIVKLKLNKKDIKLLENFKSELNNELSFKLLCIGDFSSGKSTFINKFLINDDLLPAFPKPTTTRPTIVRFGEKLKATLYYKGNTDVSIPAYEVIENNVAERLRQAVATDGKDVDKIRHVVIETPTDILKEGIEIVDAPGLNDPDAERMKITFNSMHQANAILFFLNAQQPWTKYQKDFFESDILVKDELDKLFILANYWDLVDNDEREDVLEYLNQQLSEIINQNSSEHINLNVLPISSKTGENSEIVKETIWNYLAQCKFHDVLSSKIKQFNRYSDSYIKELSEKVILLKLDQQSLDKKRIGLERDLKTYQQQKDQFIVNLKQAIRPEFDEYQRQCDVLFDILVNKLDSIMESLAIGNLSIQSINLKLSSKLSRMQSELVDDMKQKDREFLEQVKNKIEEQKGMIELPLISNVQVEDYFLKWDRISTSDQFNTASTVATGVGIASFIVGSATGLQSLAAPAVTSGLVSTIGGGLFGTTAAVSSFAVFGLPALVIGITAFVGNYFLKQQAEEEQKRMIFEISGELREDISDEKRKCRNHIQNNKEKQLNKICNDVNFEILTVYDEKLSELKNLSISENDINNLELLIHDIEILKLKVNP